MTVTRSKEVKRCSIHNMPLCKPRKDGGPHRPLYSLRECADRIGVRYGEITAAMRAHPDNHPLPEFATSNRTTGRKTHYDLVKVRTWWKQLQSQKEQTCQSPSTSPESSTSSTS